MAWEKDDKWKTKHKSVTKKNVIRVCDVMNIFLYLLVKYCYDVMIIKNEEIMKRKPESGKQMWVLHETSTKIKM